ncbi:hypothetical protein, partial [Sphaerotilus sp.]|uniref:hypothetical protein n=1 Tax=Sphaerotilus sp. TaxID=2093942 RepID=UPI0034E2E90E
TYTTADLPFNASADQLRTALLEAQDDTGRKLISVGADLSVELVSSAGQQVWQVAFGGALAAVDLDVMHGRITSTVAAPESHWEVTRTGVTLDETQRLTLDRAGAWRLSMDGATDVSAVLPAGATAAQIQAALLALPQVGAGNVQVVDGGTPGEFLLHFQGALAGRNVASVLASPVQTLNLLMNGSDRPTSVSLRSGADAAWSAVTDLAGLDDVAIAQTLRTAIGALPQINLDDVRVEVHPGQTLSFDVSFVGALAGANLPALQARLTRVVEISSPQIRIGAADVQGHFGNSQAGIDLSNGRLGLVLQRDAAGQMGYALTASATGSLHGFDGAVSLNADAELRINALGRSIDQSVLTGLSTPAQQVSFTDGTALTELTIHSGSLTVAGLGQISGALQLVSTRSTDASGAQISDLRIGLADVSGALTLGGLGAALSHGQGAVLLRYTLAADGRQTTGYAVQIDGQVGLTGVSGLTLEATRLRVAYNRMGAAVNETVAAAGGDYQVHLIDHETRVSGHARAEVAGVLAVDGDLFVESTDNVAQTLSDGRSVQTDQLTLGGSGLHALVTAGGSNLGAELSDVQLALVLSTERGATGTARRWLASEASLGAVSVAGYHLADLRSAVLKINRQLDGAGQLVESSSGPGSISVPVIDWSRAVHSVSLDQASNMLLDMAVPSFTLPISGALQIGDNTLSGDFAVTLTQTPAGRSWQIDATGVDVFLSGGGAFVGLENASGQLILNADGSRSGSLTGRASLSGVGGVGLSGTLSASFSGTALVLSGTGVALSVDGFGEMTGDFAVQRSGTGASGVLQVGLSNVNASIGNADAGLGVSGASLGLLIKQRSDGATGYALVASGAASLHGFAGVSLEAAAEVRINTLGEASTASIAVGGGQVRLDFSDATERKEVRITAGTVAVDGLGSLSGALAVHSQTTLDASGVRVTDLQIGLAQINGSLNLGGLGATLGQGRGAVLLHREGTQAGTVAVQAQGDVALTGLGSALSLTVTQMSVAYNRLGHAVEAQEVDTGAGTYVVSLLEGETRMRGVAT